MSAKEIANQYVQLLTPIALTTEIVDYKLLVNGIDTTQDTISRLRHELFTNYTEVCLQLDSEAYNHSRVYFENIKSKFKELVNNRILNALAHLVVYTYGQV